MSPSPRSAPCIPHIFHEISRTEINQTTLFHYDKQSLQQRPAGGFRLDRGCSGRELWRHWGISPVRRPNASLPAIRHLRDSSSLSTSPTSYTTSATPTTHTTQFQSYFPPSISDYLILRPPSWLKTPPSLLPRKLRRRPSNLLPSSLATRRPVSKTSPAHFHSSIRASTPICAPRSDYSPLCATHPI